MELNKEALSGKFNEFSGALKQKLGNINLSDEELKQAMSNPEQLIDLVAQKTGIPREEASQKVHQVMDTLNIDETTAKGFMAKVSDKVDKIKNKFSHH